MGTKDRNYMDQTEAEDIKKRWQEYTELYTKDLHDPEITHLDRQPGMQSQAGLTTNKAGGGDGILAELFQILKDDAVKVNAFIMPANLENSAVAIGQEKVSFHSSPKEKQCQIMFRLPHNCTHFTG